MRLMTKEECEELDPIVQHVRDCVRRFMTGPRSITVRRKDYPLLAKSMQKGASFPATSHIKVKVMSYPVTIVLSVSDYPGRGGIIASTVIPSDAFHN